MRRYTVASFILFIVLMQLFLVMLTQPATATNPHMKTTFEPYGPENPLPMVVLMEYDPWRMVIGSDSPTFALYQNGLVIYSRKNEDGEWEHASTFLTIDERDALFKEIVSPEFFELDDYYEATGWTDQPSNRLMVWGKDGEMKEVSVYGNLRPHTDGSYDEEVRAGTPEVYWQAFDTIIHFSHEDAETWLPEKFEVMLWPYDTSSGAKWPKNWPDLDDETTQKRGEDSYSVYVDIAELDTYFALSDSAVELDGRRWAYALRFPFPTEFVWMGR